MDNAIIALTTIMYSMDIVMIDMVFPVSLAIIIKFALTIGLIWLWVVLGVFERDA